MDKFIITVFILVIVFSFLRANSLSKSIVKKPSKFEMKHCHTIYSDSRPKKKLENIEYSTMLRCEKLDIQGKPDFVFESNLLKRIIPVEIKSGNIKNNNFPHEGDLMQLAAYFAVAEEEYGIRPRFGRIIYKDYMFDIKNTKSLRRELEMTIGKMRGMLDGQFVDTNYDYAKCRFCVCRGTVCKFCEK